VDLAFELEAFDPRLGQHPRVEIVLDGLRPQKPV